MPLYGMNRAQYAQFKQALEQALHEINIPSGIIEQNHIAPNSVNPSHCNLKAGWNFGANMRAGGTSVGSLKRRFDRLDERVVAVENTGSAENIVEIDTRYKAGDEDIYFLDARINKVILSLPPVSKNIGRKIYIKRVDSNKNQICRVITQGKDKLDDTDGVELNAKEAVILIASTKQWYVFSRL